jgi:TonB-like protein
MPRSPNSTQQLSRPGFGPAAELLEQRKLAKLMRVHPLVFVVLLAVGGFAESCSSAAKPDVIDPPGPPYQVISGGPVQPPVALHRVEPSRPAGVTETGRVIVQTVIGLDGVPRDITVVEAPHPKLADVSAEAVKGWRFRPGTLRGKEVETIFYIQITFH